LSRGRQRARGYNQAAAIAVALGQAWRLPVDCRLLRRVRGGPSQTELTPEQRWTNVAGAFRANQPSRPQKGEVPVILVDDILTTGATLAASAASLAQVGWDCVGGVTFARALPFEVRALAGVGRRPDRPTLT
jgi:predicted amidophosphoribosyltransferase